MRLGQQQVGRCNPGVVLKRPVRGLPHPGAPGFQADAGKEIVRLRIGGVGPQRRLQMGQRARSVSLQFEGDPAQTTMRRGQPGIEFNRAYKRGPGAVSGTCFQVRPADLLECPGHIGVRPGIRGVGSQRRFQMRQRPGRVSLQFEGHPAQAAMRRGQFRVESDRTLKHRARVARPPHPQIEHTGPVQQESGMVRMVDQCALQRLRRRHHRRHVPGLQASRVHGIQFGQGLPSSPGCIRPGTGDDQRAAQQKARKQPLWVLHLPSYPFRKQIGGPVALRSRLTGSIQLRFPEIRTILSPRNAGSYRCREICRT